MGDQKISSGDLPRKLAVVPPDFPKKYLSVEEADEVKAQITRYIISDFKVEYYPRVDSCSFSKEGALVIACPDIDTETWLKLVFSDKQVGLVYYSTFKVVNIEDLPQFTKCRMFLPISVKADMHLNFKVLERQNRGVNTAYWRILTSYVLSMDSYGGGTYYELMIDDSSLEMLKASNYSLYYLLSKVRFENMGKMMRNSATGCV